MAFTFISADAALKHQAMRDTLAALSRSQAVIAFDVSGKILSANQNFLDCMGYAEAEVLGRHHSMFVAPDYAASDEYKTFWQKLERGEFQAATFKRIGKDGREIWIEASYNPLVDKDGKVYRIVKFATDVTAKQQLAADARGQLAAVSRSQAVIEFGLDGIVLTANENFCRVLGYSLDEIVGRHHRMFVRPQDAADPDYARLWQSLGQGQYQSSQYLRVGKGGREVWIQASYNPILDADGHPYKVVKYATDITASKAAVNDLAHALGGLANGDLTCQIGGRFPHDLETVRTAFNQTVDRFSDMVRELRTTSNSLRSATGELLSGANDLAERTARQASAIEQTSAAVEQLSQTVADNAQRADTARTNARSTSDGATETGKVMVQANLAMEEVNVQSSKIASVIRLIDGIAFQTNLLALNASVEAARAGDAGKGFAVVAVEVRRLAQSAAQASSEVKGLIEQSASAVALGSKLVASASGQLTAMLGQAQDNADLMDDIALANSDQARGITEVNIAIQQMDEMTQHNASLVEQTNAAIEQTESQASRVDALVEAFVIDARAERPLPKSSRVVALPRAGAAAPKARIGHGTGVVAWRKS